MKKKPYEAPKVVEFGTVEELTRQGTIDIKCVGSGDAFDPAPPEDTRPGFHDDPNNLPPDCAG